MNYDIKETTPPPQDYSTEKHLLNKTNTYKDSSSNSKTNV